LACDAALSSGVDTAKKKAAERAMVFNFVNAVIISSWES